MALTPLLLALTGALFSFRFLLGGTGGAFLLLFGFLASSFFLFRFFRLEFGFFLFECGALGSKGIMLVVDSYNTNAINFYKKNKFDIIFPLRTCTVMGRRV